MYCIVPRIGPGAVVFMPTADVGAAACGFSFANPKSSSLAPPCVSITFPRFRSRCVIPWPCALSSASAIAIATFSASSSGIGPLAIRAARVSPSRYSITRKSMSPWRPMSNNVQMWGWFSAAMVCASRSKRCFLSGSSDKCGGNTLTATMRFSRVSEAL
jgi:hypothetical protein